MQIEYQKCLPKNGTAIGNLALMNKLEMDYDTYFEATTELIGLEKAAMDRGYGGSIKRVVSGAKKIQQIENEKDLYLIFKSWIEKDYSNVLGENIGNKVLVKGKRKNSGLWSNPDFAYFYIKNQKHFLRSLEICSFEIKKNIYDSRLGSYEALAHKRIANKAYLVFQYNDSNEELYKKIEEDCRKFGIGIILFDGIEFKISYEAQIHTPDLSKSDNFIEENLNKEEKKSIKLQHKLLLFSNFNIHSKLYPISISISLIMLSIISRP